MANEDDHIPSNGIAEPTKAEASPKAQAHVDHDAILPADDMRSGDNTTMAKTTNGKSGEENEKSMEPKGIEDNEGQVKKYPYPKSIGFIISNEFCERFNFYGMRTILVLYLSRQLGYSKDFATVMFHVFIMLVYFLCVFGAIISDSWLGKFKTILYLSLVYVAGSVMMTLGAIPPLNLPGTTFTMIGLALIALGSGGIKPCVSAFGGDQFKLPEQVKQMTTFFSLFYFAINSGSLISTTVTPILREDVRCFDGGECYSLAFGVPAVLMILSIVIFLLGKPLYIIKPPAGNMVVLVSKTVWAALTNKCKEKKTNPREHWLDYADTKYDKQLISDTKVLMRVLWLFVPLPVFWALFDQQGSRWVFQATRMDGDMGSWSIKPDQMNLINPLLILVFIPLYEVAFYPLLNLVGVRRPLQKLTLGGVLAGVAFVLSALVELQVEKTYPLLPQPMSAQMRIFNGEPCEYSFTTNIPNQLSFNVPRDGYFEWKDVPIPDGTFNLEYKVTAQPTGNEECKTFPAGSWEMKDKTAYSMFLSSMNPKGPYDWYIDDVDKPEKSDPLVRTLANVRPDRTITFQSQRSGGRSYSEPAYTHNLTEFVVGEYKILIDNDEVAHTNLKYGGVYTFIIDEVTPGNYVPKEVIVTEPNSVNILWQIPQFVILTLGEVMFSVTGLEFSYSQAPLSMKSVLTSCWLLTVAFGNVLVIIIAEADMFDSQASEFFLFAGLMFVDMFFFAILAYFYVPNNPMEDSETEPLVAADAKTTIPALTEKKGIENQALEKEKE